MLVQEGEGQERPKELTFHLFGDGRENLEEPSGTSVKTTRVITIKGIIVTIRTKNEGGPSDDDDDDEEEEIGFLGGLISSILLGSWHQGFFQNSSISIACEKGSRWDSLLSFYHALRHLKIILCKEFYVQYIKSKGLYNFYTLY